MTQIDKADRILKYLGGDWDVVVCNQCGTEIVVETNDGLPQTCNRVDCVYQELKNEITPPGGSSTKMGYLEA
jgi:hypothetical protein